MAVGGASISTPCVASHSGRLAPCETIDESHDDCCGLTQHFEWYSTSLQFLLNFTQGTSVPTSSNITLRCLNSTIPATIRSAAIIPIVAAALIATEVNTQPLRNRCEVALYRESPRRSC